jgi:hypothetical protein
LKGPGADKARKNKKAKATTSTTSMPKATSKPRIAAPAPSRDDSLAKTEKSNPSRRGWLSRLFHWGGNDVVVSDRSRPPSSGRLDWVIVDEWSDEKDNLIKNSLDKASKSDGDKAAAGKPDKPSDNFQIGVQDWRDPDLVAPSSKDNTAGKTTEAKKQQSKWGASAKLDGKASSSPAKDANGPQGGSITPGSGEYVPELVTDDKTRKADGATGSDSGIIGKLFGDDDSADFAANESPGAPATAAASSSSGKDGGAGHREGLWITITPTSSASPFFDTLLVLVISPLITLTVVYALLILRAKLRRRRWRAPKSVVERLPVRTYHTVATSGSQTPRLPSPTSSSPTTPLLQGSSRARPRSRTTTGVPESADLLRVDAALQTPRSPRSPSHEKGSPQTSSEWKKYMGRQVECVVCLEEYVDGVSRVMSLPCGHEFHAECMYVKPESSSSVVLMLTGRRTPWLTTRRRTCPICKGDVVRSLARGSPSNPRYDAYHDDSDDDDLEASGSGANRAPSPERPLDIERGGIRAPSRGRRIHRNEGWFSMISSSLGAGSSVRHQRDDSREDRNR